MELESRIDGFFSIHFEQRGMSERRSEEKTEVTVVQILERG